ncbi:PP2C family protein-serine/threonine phosphatase, partial [Enterococcus faecalis]|uniref:PP2C family protein-serine/threonine phosphatase n=2 Tax=Bacillati TaxID=1783272 RepID=UPI003D6C114C
LTAPPQPDHGQIVVRYVPAAQAAEVGGDWYDAFLQPGGATALVIGDVVGHDTQAAAAMGQIRTIVRTLGARDDDGPAAVV